MTPNDKLTIEDTEKALMRLGKMETFTRIEAMYWLEQLASTMRENERLRSALTDILNAEAIMVNAGCRAGIDENLKTQARESLSNKDSVNPIQNR